MTPEETIEFLKGMQNKKIDYAEMVCAPAFAYGYEYVYPEPEDYAIEEAITALKEVQQYREIGTVEECREAMEKQKPKVCIIEFHPDRTYYKCQSCGKTQLATYEYGFPRGGRMTPYCEHCGQAIQWEESEEK